VWRTRFILPGLFTSRIPIAILTVLDDPSVALRFAE
jgi:hypothetical protein